MVDKNVPTTISLMLTLSLLLACSLFTAPQPTQTPELQTVALTSTSTVTPTPSHPVFSSGEILEIPSISPIVGRGKVIFSEGEDAGNLTVHINGTIPIVEGYWCLCCVDSIQIKPNLKIPISPFFVETKAPPAPGGLISESMELDNLVLLSPIPEDATVFIVSGPEGATLKKEGSGFLLVEGSAYLLETAEASDPPANTPEPDVVINLGPGRFGKPLYLEVIKGDYQLTTGATLFTGSAIDANEDWLTFPWGLVINVKDGEITLKGKTYPAGTTLYVDGQGNLTER
jgi:hypothetical protein